MFISFWTIFNDLVDFHLCILYHYKYQYFLEMGSKESKQNGITKYYFSTNSWNFHSHWKWRQQQKLWETWTDTDISM